jgi:hypothetical protein
MVTITCGACRKPISLDPAKIPPRPVSFPCPACKAPVPVDGRTLAAAAPEPPPAPEPDEFAPKALIVGQDDPALRHAAQVLGFQAVHFPTVEACRDFFLQEHPPVVFLNPGQLTRPPLAEIQPLTSVGPVDRRKGFFILLGDGLKTMDGTVAFLYDVDLVITYRDLPSLHRIYREAKEHHQHLYQSFEAAQRELRG